MNFGRQLIVTYLVLFYVIPHIGNSLFGDRIFTIYTITPVSNLSLAMFFVTVVVFLVGERLPKIRILPTGVAGQLHRFLSRIGVLYLRFRLWVAVVSILLSVPYLAAGFTSYRYSLTSLSESDSSLVLVMVVLNLLINADFFYCIFVRPFERVPILSRRYVENVLLALMLVATANGTGSMLLALISLAYSLSPSFFYRFVFISRTQSWWRRARRSLIVVVAIPAVFAGAWASGEIIKMSSSTRYQGLANGWTAFSNVLVRSPQIVENFGYYMIGAVSTAYHSLNMTTQTPRAQLNGGEAWALVHPLQSFVFRLDYLTGRIVDVPRPAYGSLSRLNYALLSDERQISARQGTSPGLLASFVYIFPFPLSALFCALYLRWVSRATNRLLGQHRHERLSFPAMLLLLFNMLVFFQAPFDLLPIFDNATMYAAILLGVAYVCRPQRKRAAVATVPHADPPTGAAAAV
jgi:hypothetical protein